MKKKKLSSTPLPPKAPLKPQLRRLLSFILKIGGICALLFCLLRFTPYHELEAFRARPHSVRFYDRNGILLQISPVENGAERGLRREKASLNEIPRELQEAVLFAEDRRFFYHFGVDIAAAARAALVNLQNGRIVSGASTITMQLARLVSSDGRSQPPSLGEKLKESLNALRLETRLSKKQLLELYLNSIPAGYQSCGVSSAARTFFSKDLKELSSPEMYLLAVSPRRPAKYSPLANPVESAKAAFALYKKKNPFSKLYSFDDFESAAHKARQFRYPFEAPHLVRYLDAELKKEKAEVTECSLTLDLRVQHFAERLIADNVEKHRTARLSNGAALVLENESGAILAWVGSADFFNEASAGQIDGVLALNQPGSSMKPLLYALALEKGYEPSAVLADVPRAFGGSEAYIPANFNGRFSGPVLFRSALASSLNLPAVRLLAALGLESYTQKLLELGFESLRDSAQDAGLGLALGNAPVSLLELVRAFSVFPNDGILRGEVSPLASALCAYATPLSGAGQSASPPRNAPRGIQVFESGTARIIASFLSDKAARAPAFGTGASFETPFPSMWKTGTANQFQSITALGATPLWTAGVWMGNFTGETVLGKTGSSLPAETVRDILVFLQGKTGSSFKAPENYALSPVCALSGLKPGEYCPSKKLEWVKKGSEASRAACLWHREEGLVYPAEYQSWFFAADRKGELDQAEGTFALLSPRQGAVFYADYGGEALIPIEAAGGGSSTLSLSLDGEKSFFEERPFSLLLKASKGEHRLVAKAGNEEKEVEFFVK